MKIGTPGPVSFLNDHQFGLLLIRKARQGWAAPADDFVYPIR